MVWNSFKGWREVSKDGFKARMKTNPLCVCVKAHVHTHSYVVLIPSFYLSISYVYILLGGRSRTAGQNLYSKLSLLQLNILSRAKEPGSFL